MKYFGSMSPEKIGAGVGVALWTLWKLVFPRLSEKVTGALVKKDQQITDLKQREREEEAAAEVFTRDNEIARLHEMLVGKQQELDRYERDNARLELLVRVLEEGKLEAEMALAEEKIERKTGQHRGPPATPVVPREPARRVDQRSRSLDDQLDTDRPRSASRQLPAPERIPPDRIPSPRIPPPVTPGRGPGRRDRP